jgi:NACalpha-BTF3-like transcription factor
VDSAEIRRNAILYKEDIISLVTSQVHVTPDDAIEAYIQGNGDVVNAIILLQKKKNGGRGEEGGKII